MVKKMFLIVSLLLMLISIGIPAQAYVNEDERLLLRYDRMLHFSFGYMTAMPLKMWTDRLLVERGYERGDYGVVSLGLPILLGYFKEVYDHKTMNFTKWRSKLPYNSNDAYYDFFGVALGAVCGRYMTYTF